MQTTVVPLLLALTMPETLEEVFMPPTQDQHVELVCQLGSEFFEKREEANRELVKLGWDALRAVKAGRSDKDLEIANRCRRIYYEYYVVAPPLCGFPYTEGPPCCDFPCLTQIPFAKKIKTNKGVFVLANEHEIRLWYQRVMRKRADEGWYVWDPDIQKKYLTEMMHTYIQLLMKCGLPREKAVEILTEAQQNEEPPWRLQPIE